MNVNVKQELIRLADEYRARIALIQIAKENKITAREELGKFMHDNNLTNEDFAVVRDDGSVFSIRKNASEWVIRIEEFETVRE